MEKLERAKVLFLEGVDLLQQEQFVRAETILQRALEYAPERLSIRINLAAALLGQRRHVEAESIARDVLAQDSQCVEALINLVHCLLERRDRAALEYAQNIVDLAPDSADGWLCLGDCYLDADMSAQALECFSRAVELAPDSPQAWLGCANSYRQAKRFEEALLASDRVLSLRQDWAGFWKARGNLFSDMKRVDEALDCYAKAMALDPDLPNISGHRVAAAMLVADWRDKDELVADVFARLEKGQLAIDPFDMLAVTGDALLQLKCARTFVQTRVNLKVSDYVASMPSRRIRVGYFSSDFKAHAVSFLTAGLFEAHDRDRFEIWGFSLSEAESDPWNQRIRSACEHFVRLDGMSTDSIVKSVRECCLDIAIDLNGLTLGNRINMFAQRIAPVQINYLGYPGTSGADFMDYIIADEVLIPEADRAAYAEKIMYMQNCFQVNDSKRRMSEPLSRLEYGLPPTGLVFGSFCNSYKITPEHFDVWLRLLKAVPKSVLWLLRQSDAQAGRLRARAAAYGVGPERIVFAGTLPYADHLARYRHMDVALDTAPFGGGTTSSDALWAGVPLVTRMTNAFAGRMSASLLNSLGLKSLITDTLDSYFEVACGLARSPEHLQAVKVELQTARASAAVFDTVVFTRNLEDLYSLAHERRLAGDAPEHLVPGNRNKHYLSQAVH